MNKNYCLLLLSLLLTVCPEILHAQKDQIPLDAILEASSERQLIKIGMITDTKPAKLKFGTYSTENREGVTTTGDDDQPSLLFSFDVENGKGDIAHVEASQNNDTEATSKQDQDQHNLGVYITTSLDDDDLWVLLITQPLDNQDLSLNDIFFTNGTDEIVFKHVVGIPTGKTENTAPRGIEAFMDDYPIGAMQYYSGGSFSYKKFIWLSEKNEPQIQLVLASVFAAMMEIGDYFEDYGFTD